MYEVDLEALAAAYTFRPISDVGRARAATAGSNALDPLLDVGGGDGSHAAVWAARGRRSIVVDLSAEMTRRAGANRNVEVVRGDAHCLPFADDSVGLAYFHMSIHYGDWRATLTEAVRVVRAGGLIEIWTFAPHDIARSSLGRWFPTVASIDIDRFPSPTDLAEQLSRSSTEVVVDTSSETLERSARAWVESVRARFVSTLQFVPDDELEAGIERFTEQYPNDDDIYRSEMAFTRVRCIV